MDSKIYTSKMQPGADSLEMSPHNTIYLDFSYDYIVEVPAAGKTWKINGINLQAEKMSSNGCTGAMTYYLNDSMYTIPPNINVANLPGIITLQ